MAKVIDGMILLNSGKLIVPQDAGWYDERQYYNGTLGRKGEIHPELKKR